MNLDRLRIGVLLAGLALCAAPASAQLLASGSGPNLLQNPGFDLGAIGQVAPPSWTLFGNGGVADVCSGVPSISQPNSGFLFGTFPLAPCPMPCDSVMLQTVQGVVPGEAYAFTVRSHHPTGNPLTGQSSVIAVVDFGTQGVVLGSVMKTIKTVSSPTGVWTTDVIQAIAPPGTTEATVILVFVQVPINAQGVCHLDDLSFQRMSPTLQLTTDPITSDLTSSITGGSPSAFYGQFFSFDLLNGNNEGNGPFGGIFLDPLSISSQINLALTQVFPFGGFLDGSGSISFVVPGTFTSMFANIQLWSVAIEVQGLALSASNVSTVVL